VRAAKERGALDEHYVEEAVESAQRDIVIEALALLSNSQRSVIERIFSSRSSKAITALAWKAGLTMRIGFKIQTMLLKLPADELLPARAGVAFPLSEQEMRWHLSYFGFPEGIRPSTRFDQRELRCRYVAIASRGEYRFLRSLCGGRGDATNESRQIRPERASTGGFELGRHSSVLLLRYGLPRLSRSRRFGTRPRDGQFAEHRIPPKRPCSARASPRPFVARRWSAQFNPARSGRIGVAYLDWSSAPYTRIAVNWRVIRDKASAEAFAEAL